MMIFMLGRGGIKLKLAINMFGVHRLRLSMVLRECPFPYLAGVKVIGVQWIHILEAK